MRSGLSVAGLVVLLGCTTVDKIPTGVDCGPRPDEAAVVRAVEGWKMGSGLKDPMSAQVSGYKILGPRGWYRGVANGGGMEYGWEVEFLVNAKNSYGAYTGFKARHVLLTPDGRHHWRMEIDY